LFNLKLAPLEGKTGNNVSFIVATKCGNFGTFLDATCHVKVMGHV